MRKGYRFFGTRIAAILTLFVAGSMLAYAQGGLGNKFLPILSLQKEQPTNNPGGDVISGDTVYISQPGFSEKRLLLMPIFIHNCLDSTADENPVGHPGERIYSFSFQMQYNNCMMKAVGVTKRGALPNDTNVLARQFNLSWDTKPEPNYKLPTTGGTSAFGERITVEGSSSIPLPRSPATNPGIQNPRCDDRDYTPFLYVVFEIVGDAQGGTCGITSDQMILVRDSIRWNDYSPTNVTPEMLARGFDPVQVGVFPQPIFPITYPNDYGSAIASITRQPRIDLGSNPQDVVFPNSGDNSDYVLTRPLQTQFGYSRRIYRELVITNGIAGSFLTNLIIETNQPWLRIDTNDPSVAPGVQQGERRVILRRADEAQEFLNIVANPSLIPSPPADFPTPGRYVGTVTIRSVDAINSAVELEVELIVNRNPLEPQLDPDSEPTQRRGMSMLFRSSASIPRPDSTYLTMGTGIGATDGVDTLFGELEAVTPPTANTFYARFFPPSLSGFNGMIDGRELYTGLNREPETSNNGEASIDIRNYDIETIHTYCVNFDTRSPNDYPVVLEYDLNDIPDGAQLFFKQDVAGVPQVTNMRTEGAVIGATKRAVFIADPSVKSFCIDYLLPNVVQFPDINRGWNFVSLPVDPSDPRSGSVFPNSNSGAIRFTQNQYSKEVSVRAGIGYFVKYGDIKDETVSGVPVMLIHEILTQHRVRLFEGWNTVGALSVPTEVSQIDFGSYQGSPIPSLDGEVYRYLTSQGYEQASRIVPGYGYWIKVTGDAWYRLFPLPKATPGSEVAKPYRALNNLRIADNGQHENTQLYFGFGSLNEANYEMPPVPGVDMFDVRFDNNGFVSSSTQSDAEHVVNLTGVDYPVVISSDDLDATYRVTDAETGAYIGELKSGEAGSISIDNPLTKSVKLTRVPAASIDLSEAYPNPVENNFTFDVAVPDERQVTVTLFNARGEEVADIFDGTVSNRESIEVDASGLSSGVYMYKLRTDAGETMFRQVVINK